MERSVYSIYFTKNAKKEAVDFLVGELERNKWKVSFSDGENRTLLIHPTLEGLYLSAERYFLYKKCNSVPPFQPFNSDVKERIARTLRTARIALQAIASILALGYFHQHRKWS